MRRLTGYGPSVYTRAVRIALAELGLGYDWQEADPFAGPVPGHPFGRVPVLEDDGFVIYETWAILTYLAAPGDTARQRARAAQVAGIVDSYGYWPLVRQVYAHAVFAPSTGGAGDPAEVAKGLAAAGPVLDALEGIAAEGEVLTGDGVGPADWLLYPMLDAFAEAPEGRAMLARRGRLAGWHARMARRPAFAGTRTDLREET